MQSVSPIVHFVGIDVSAGTLDVHVRPSEERFVVRHSRSGFWDLIGRLGVFDACLIVLEPTGGYERAVADLLVEAGHEVAIVNARQIRDYAKATGRLAKTDRLDAEVIALFAEAVKPRQRHSVDRDRAALSGLVTRRRQLVEMIKAEGYRLKRVNDRLVQRRLRAHLTWLKREQASMEAELRNAIDRHPIWQQRAALLTSVPGVGPTVAATLMADLPELGAIDRRRLASLVGVAPFNRDSGSMRGKRTIWGGRSSLRANLYMATLVAIQHNPTIRSFNDRLRQAGKPPKVAITACMRKLITILNAIVRHNQLWKEAASCP